MRRAQQRGPPYNRDDCCCYFTSTPTHHTHHTHHHTHHTHHHHHHSGVEFTLMEPAEYANSHPLLVPGGGMGSSPPGPNAAGGGRGGGAVAGPAAMEKSMYDARALLEEMERSKVREGFIRKMREGFDAGASGLAVPRPEAAPAPF